MSASAYEVTRSQGILGYIGQMTNFHLRAAIQVSLAARGLELDPVSYNAAVMDQWHLGCRVRDKIVAALGDPACARELQESLPDLWARMPLMAGLGSRETSVFQTMMNSADENEKAAFLGGAFNLAIVLIDHYVDELGLGQRVFNVLNESLIRDIFTDPVQASSLLTKIAENSGDAREQFLFRLIALCASTGAELLSRAQNYVVWKDLGRSIAYQLDGERRITRSMWPTRSEMCELLPAMEAKSSLPLVAAMQIARLAQAPELADSGAGEMLASAKDIGTVFWIIDDLVDLLDDLRAGVGNRVLLCLNDRLAEEGRWHISDTDIYEEIEQSTMKLAPLLGLTRPADAGRRMSAAVQEFARFVVAGWTHWNEQEDPMRRGAQVEARSDKSFTARHALHFLLTEQADEYKNAVHHLHFPRLLLHGVEYQTQPAIVSHRAVILDSLLDAAEAGLPLDPRILAKDVMEILRCKHRDVRGGWSYIQKAPELPPDADDLGQVLQCLVRYGGSDLASVCDEAIRLVLDYADESGGLCTWILDPNGVSPADGLIRSYLGVMGGWGVHPEVVANMLYGLLLYDAERYREALHRGVRYLEAVQDPAGYWMSKWYKGPFYGTWRALSVLERLSPVSGTSTAARDFLLEAQRVDGSWGESVGEPLSTAFAILSLCTDVRNKTSAAVSSGEAYLRETQRANGSWEPVPWIAFPTIDGDVVHGSASITTAFAMKALLATAH